MILHISVQGELSGEPNLLPSYGKPKGWLVGPNQCLMKEFPFKKNTLGCLFVIPVIPKKTTTYTTEVLTGQPSTFSGFGLRQSNDDNSFCKGPLVDHSEKNDRGHLEKTNPKTRKQFFRNPSKWP